MDMLEAILYLYTEAQKLTAKSIPLSQLLATGIFSALCRMKFEMGEGKTGAEFIKMIDDAVSAVLAGNE